jgi:hypothetical protein
MIMDDIDDWVAALRGQANKNASPQTILMAKIMREAIIERENAKQPDAEFMLSPGSEDAFIAKARAEGLLPEKISLLSRAKRYLPGWLHHESPVKGNSPGLAESRSHSFRWAGAGGLAIMFGLLIMVAPWKINEPPEILTTREIQNGINVLHVAKPSVERDRLAQDLAKLGINAKQYQRLGRLGLDADLPKSLPPELTKLLRHWAIQPSVDSVLTVEFEEQRNE